MEEREQVFIGLGANVGASRRTLERAVASLAALPATALAGVSRLYRTRPVGPVEQGEFLNAAVRLWAPAGARPEEGAMALLLALKGLERALGRVPRERWGPREIDLDLLLFGAHALHLERAPGARSLDAAVGAGWLDVPHRSAVERAFVLAPLADLAPDLIPPGWGMSVAAALARALAVEGPDAVEPVGEWDEGGGCWGELRTAKRPDSPLR